MNLPINKRPMPRGECLDCASRFPLHKALRSVTDPLLQENEIDIYVCPECGSYAVEETSLETEK